MTLDQIILTGMVFYGFHGVAPEEKTLGQRFIVDLSVRKDLRRAGESDDLSQTVDYTGLFRLTKQIVEGPSFDLIEAVAHAIASEVVSRFDVESVTITVKKPDVPIKGSVLDSVAVRVHRERG